MTPATSRGGSASQNLFHALSWTSPEAERSLLGDLHTANVELRLAVEFALGRVSADPRVVEALLDTLQNDPTPLFRDKAACALAYDQVHLAEPQKVRLYEGLIQALSNPEPQVQAVSIQALSILTGETKGFHPLLPPSASSAASTCGSAGWRSGAGLCNAGRTIKKGRRTPNLDSVHQLLEGCGSDVSLPQPW